MLFFRIINLNISGVFVYLSYSPFIFIYILLILFIFFGLSLWTFFFDVYINIIILFVFIFALYLLFSDIILDNLYGINENTTLYRTMQYCFVWFILSEAGLFLTFFWSSFALNLLVTLEFNSFFICIPSMYSYFISHSGFVFYWFYLDLFNIIINTFFLFFSGVFCNYFYLFIFYKSLYVSILFALVSVLTGFLFIWNQLWEFALLSFSISTNSFCTNLFSIDLLHFSHVSLGVFLIFISLFKLFNTQISNLKLVYFSCIVLYWHFVDVVWFILLRFLYFSILCIVFLL